MRYKSTGEVHKDFHGLACATLHYLVDHYGREAMVDVLQSTAKNVYKSIHESLKAGEVAELVEHLGYYLEREGGAFKLESTAAGVRLCVDDCPALRHLVKLGQKPDPILCEATRIFNEALADGTPFCAEVRRTGDFSCVQTFYKEGRNVSQ